MQHIYKLNFSQYDSLCGAGNKQFYLLNSVAYKFLYKASACSRWVA